MNIPEINRSQLNNVFEVDKALGLPTNAYVEYFKRVLHAKVGQGGTLDPLAEGKIVILTGNSTKMAQTYLDHKKVYKMTVLLGVKSASGDLEQPLEFDNIREFSEEEIQRVVASFEGESIQRVPLFSAAKQEGKSQYKMMRSGGQPPVPKERTVQIHFLNPVSIEKIDGNVLCDLIEKKIVAIETAYQEMKALFEAEEAHLPGKFLWVKDSILQNLTAEKEGLLKNHKESIFTLVSLNAEVTKGTYMRSLAEDIGEKLGTYGVTFNLRRTGV